MIDSGNGQAQGAKVNPHKRKFSLNGAASKTQILTSISVIIALMLGGLVAASAQPTLGFRKSVIEISEAEDFLVIALELSQVLAEPGEISFSTEDGTAQAGEDYTATNGVLHIEAGLYAVSTNSAVIRIPLLKDATREADETFFVHLRNPAGTLRLASRTNLEVHILDNDQGIRFAQEGELQSGPGTNAIEILRGDDGSNDVTVEYSTVAGTALPGSDFQESNGTVIFRQGEASKVIEISIAENDLLETDETFTVALRNPTGGALGNPITRTIRVLNGQPHLLSAIVLTNLPFAEPEPNKQAIGIALQGEYAYMTYMLGLLVFNISDPARPVQIANTNLSGLCLGIALATNYAFIANFDYGLLVMDIQQPSEPKIVAHLHVGAATDLALSGHYAYVATYEGLAVVDLADPSRPVLLTNQPSGGTYTTGVAVQGNFAFVAAFDAGLQVFDLIDPAKPGSVGYAPMPGIARSVAVSGGYAYLTGGTNLLQVVSITNPVRPEVIARMGGGSDARSIFIAEPYACVTDYSAGLYVLNISRPSTPYLVAAYYSRSSSATARDRNIYLADAWSGLTVLGIAPILDPSVPVGGGFQFLLKSLANRPVRIERSPNLQDWEIWRQMTPDREVVRITDSQPGDGAMFYRAGAE